MIVRNNDEIGEKMILCEIGIVLPKQYEIGQAVLFFYQSVFFCKTRCKIKEAGTKVL